VSATRRRAVERTTAVLAVLTLVATFAGVALTARPASASRLDVVATAPSWLERQACTTSSVLVVSGAPTAGTTTSVTVEDLTEQDLAACAGLPIRVAVATAGGDVLADVSGTVGPTTPTFAVSFPTADAALAAVLVGGFALPTAWVAPPVDAGPVVGCEVLFDDRDEVDDSRTCRLTFHPDADGRDDWFSVKIDVTTDSVQPVRWRATLDFADVTVFGFVARFVGEYQGNLVVQPVTPDHCTADQRMVTITGTGWRQTVSSTNPRLLDLVGNNVSPVGNPVLACP
jgi:hypothetical protein